MMLAVGGGALNCQAPPLERSGEGHRSGGHQHAVGVDDGLAADVKAGLVLQNHIAVGVEVPRICDGLGSLIWFQTTEEDEGWTKVVVWPAPMLKLCQLMKALSEVWMVNCEPWGGEGGRALADGAAGWIGLNNGLA